MIKIKNVSKAYALTDEKNKIALYNVNMTLPEKGMVFICGTSGSGKSTLLNILGGIDKPTRGTVVFDGISFSGFTDKDYSDYRNNMVGFIFQEFNLIENIDVEQNLMLPLNLQNEKKDVSSVEKALKDVGLEGFEKRKINELSVGEMQRVAIARALIKKPRIILADEPTGNLDAAAAKDVFKMLKALSKENLVVIVTHDVESAKLYSDFIVGLANGQVVYNSIPAKNFSAALPTADETQAAALGGNAKIEEIYYVDGPTADSADKKSLEETHGNPLKKHKEKTAGSEKLPDTKRGNIRTKKLITALPLSLTVKMGAGNLLKRPVRALSIILVSLLTILAITFSQLHIGSPESKANAWMIQKGNLPVFSVVQTESGNTAVDESAFAKLTEKHPAQYLPLFSFGNNFFVIAKTSREVVDFGFEFAGAYNEPEGSSIYLTEEMLETVYNDIFGTIKTGDGIKKLLKSEYPPEKLVGKEVSWYRYNATNEYFVVAGIIKTSDFLQSLGETERAFYAAMFSKTVVANIDLRGKAALTEFLIKTESVKNLAAFSAEVINQDLEIKTPYSKTIGSSYDYSKMKNVFIVLSIVLSALMLLLIINLIFFGITDRSNELGILKALGASNKDINAIFLAEIFFISAIVFVLSVALAFLGAAFLDCAYAVRPFVLRTFFADFWRIATSGQLVIKRFVVDLWTILTIFIFSFDIPFIAAFASLKKINGMVPAEAINAD